MQSLQNLISFSWITRIRKLDSYGFIQSNPFSFAGKLHVDFSYTPFVKDKLNKMEQWNCCTFVKHL